MPFAKTYGTLYERLVANTVLAVEDNCASCWLWKGSTAGDGPYPRVAIRIPGKKNPLNRAAHRVMLEEFFDIEFPHDEGGHKCCVPACINPMHLEVETAAMNSIQRRGHVPRASTLEACMIPTLYPRATHASNDPDINAGQLCAPGEPCPF